jgi:hypothetical protein
LKHRPSPAGFGPIACHWQPRVGFAGTYGDAWVANRLPLLPDDFDDRFFQSAPGISNHLRSCAAASGSC